MGESERKRNLTLAAEAAMPVDTLGGRMLVHRDEGAQATPNGQPVFLLNFWLPQGSLITGFEGNPPKNPSVLKVEIYIKEFLHEEKQIH